jgi:hypothetical protein
VRSAIWIEDGHVRVTLMPESKAEEAVVAVLGRGSLRARAVSRSYDQEPPISWPDTARRECLVIDVDRIAEDHKP